MSYQKKNICVKHLSHKEHLDLESLEQDYIKDARSKGLNDEKAQLQYLKDNNLWNESKDNDIINQKYYINNLIVNKKNITLPSVLNSVLNQIKDAEKKLFELESEKRDLLGLTCESYSSKLVNEQYIKLSLFKDTSFKELFFNEEDYEDLSDDDLNGIVILYNQCLEICSDQNIKKLAIQDFFQFYYFLCDDNIFTFYGKPIVDLTYFQIKLANHAKYFKYIFENNDIKNFPEETRNDPDKLSDYINTAKKGKENLDNQSGDAVGLVGATKEDLETLGVQQKKQNPSEDLKEMLKLFPG